MNEEGEVREGMGGQIGGSPGVAETTRPWQAGDILEIQGHPFEVVNYSQENGTLIARRVAEQSVPAGGAA